MIQNDPKCCRKGPGKVWITNIEQQKKVFDIFNTMFQLKDINNSVEYFQLKKFNSILSKFH